MDNLKSDLPLKSRLADIKKSITEMSDDELYELIGGSRNNRRNPPVKEKPVRKKTTAPAKTTKAEAALFAGLDSMSPEELATLLEQLKAAQK